MQIKGEVTFLLNTDGAKIEVYDQDANVCILKIDIGPEEVLKMLGRQGHVKCDARVYDNNFAKIGKTHENKDFVFEIENRPYSARYSDQELKELADSQLTDGWVSDCYFGSQNSRFTKDGKEYARAVIRRWI